VRSVRNLKVLELYVPMHYIYLDALLGKFSAKGIKRRGDFDRQGPSPRIEQVATSRLPMAMTNDIRRNGNLTYYRTEDTIPYDGQVRNDVYKANGKRNRLWAIMSLMCAADQRTSKEMTFDHYIPVILRFADIYDTVTTRAAVPDLGEHPATDADLKRKAPVFVGVPILGHVVEASTISSVELAVYMMRMRRLRYYHSAMAANHVQRTKHAPLFAVGHVTKRQHAYHVLNRYAACALAEAAESRKRKREE